MLQKLSQLLVLWVGAEMVLKGALTLGQLIAFRNFSGFVTQPLLRLSSDWQNIQELQMSFERLADVINTPVESNQDDQTEIPLPPISGHVQFEAMTFAFQPGAAPVLNNIYMVVKAGTFIGIVDQRAVARAH